MAALTKDKVGTHREGKLRGYPVATSVTLFKNALVMVLSTGFLAPGADTASAKRCVGVSESQHVNAGANGLIDARVVSGVTVRVAGSSLTQAMVGDPMYLVDDQTVAAAGVTSNDVLAGYMERYISASECDLYIPEGGAR